MKILGTLTVDTADALDKVTDFNADLLDGKSSALFLSKNTTADATITGNRFAQRNDDTTIPNANLQLQLANGNDFVIFTALSTDTTYADTTNSLTIKSTGKIGIGRANPAAKLHLHLTSTEQTTDALSPFVISNSADTALFQVDYNGKVSIGKSTIGDSPTNLLGLYLADTAAGGGISIKSTYVSLLDIVTLNMDKVGSNHATEGRHATLYTNKKLYISSDQDTIFSTANVARFTIASSGGNILIGTTTNDGVNKLQVSGNITAANYLLNVVAGTYGKTNDTSIEMRTAGDAAPAMHFRAGSGSAIIMSVVQLGKVGIGIVPNSSTPKFTVLESTSLTNTITTIQQLIVDFSGTGTVATGFGVHSQFVLEDVAGNFIGTGGIRNYWVNPDTAVRSANVDIQASLGNSQVTVATFTSGGKVGIGTAIPAETLDVVGNAKVSGTLSVGGAITADNINNSYLWVFKAAADVLSYTTSPYALTADNYIQPRSGDGVGTSLTTAPNFYNKNVCVYRSNNVSSAGISYYEQVFPDVEISTGGVCTIKFLASQTNYVFRVVFS